MLHHPAVLGECCSTALDVLATKIFVARIAMSNETGRHDAAMARRAYDEAETFLVEKARRADIEEEAERADRARRANA